MGLKMNIAKTKVMVEDNTPINVNNVLIESNATCTRNNTTASRKITRTKRYNEESWQVGPLGGIRQTPGYLQKQLYHLPEETGVQLMCAASSDIWCRDLDNDQTSSAQTCGSTYQNGKKYAQHHIQR